MAESRSPRLFPRPFTTLILAPLESCHAKSSSRRGNTSISPTSSSAIRRQSSKPRKNGSNREPCAVPPIQRQPIVPSPPRPDKMQRRFEHHDLSIIRLCALCSYWQSPSRRASQLKHRIPKRIHQPVPHRPKTPSPSMAKSSNDDWDRGRFSLEIKPEIKLAAPQFRPFDLGG